jgi:hypothetical protein
MLSTTLAIFTDGRFGGTNTAALNIPYMILIILETPEPAHKISVQCSLTML